MADEPPFGAAPEDDFADLDGRREAHMRREAVQDALARLSITPYFRDAPRCREALKIVVLASLSGRTVTPSGLAEVLYGKDSKYQRDAARAIWSDVRERLAACQRDAVDGRRVAFKATDAPYRVEFTDLLPTEAPAPSPETATSAPAVPPAPRPLSRMWTTVTASMALAVAISALALVLATRDRVWTLASVEATNSGLKLYDANWVPLTDFQERVAKVTGCPAELAQEGAQRTKAVIVRGPSGELDRLAVICAPADEAQRTGLYLFAREDLSLLGSLPLPWMGPGSNDGIDLHDTSEVRLSRTWRVVDLQAVDLDPRLPGEEILLSLAHNPNYPTQVLALSWLVEPGILTATWSMGHTHELDTADLDGDRILEILTVATNNDFHRPMLLVMNLDGATCRTPEGPRSLVPQELRGLPECVETILLPRTPVSLDPTRRQVHAPGHLVDQYEYPNKVRVLTEDAQAGGGGSKNIIWTFDREGGSTSVSIQQHDWHAAEMRALIAADAIEDRWEIDARLGLEKYEPSLLEEIKYLGAPARRLIPPPLR